MKSLYLGLICLLLVSACKSETPTTEEIKDATIAEKIANAHGFENWKNVEEVKFTFQVDRDTIKGSSRSWTWSPKKGSVIFEANYGSIEYTRSQMDSTHVGTDKGFINDKFWLLVPFQLIWDASAKISESKKAEAPISKDELNMITLLYSNEGGYTPGDAYDIFYSDDYLIKEWVFRKSNTEEPTMATTFENYKNYNGIKIATDHKMAGGNWNLNFTDVSITLNK
ncbi:hypothetical protein [Winogradskyella sp. UBA3174]|uniref:hypothetical protein n=1 Tax=Winogradskyella sp. UBA3174 TaxID=1947785 RepID=UPI0025D8B120|nr:hypothetical protein [Winogradskyella sp. UBA3174]|tara:strand:- start:40464 stop:41138 length:675 start_codon:yes stop_codon:yes gene_type:complete